MLSRKTGYAILALACIDQDDGPWQRVKEIAARTGIPRPYLAQILGTLVQAGLLVSKRGYRGGVALAQDPAEIRLIDVVKALEGPNWLPDCLLGLDATCQGAHACPTHEFWDAEKARIRAELCRVTVADTNLFAAQSLLDQTIASGAGDGI